MLLLAAFACAAKSTENMKSNLPFSKCKIFLLSLRSFSAVLLPPSMTPPVHSLIFCPTVRWFPWKHHAQNSNETYRIYNLPMGIALEYHSIQTTEIRFSHEGDITFMIVFLVVKVKLVRLNKPHTVIQNTLSGISVAEVKTNLTLIND